MRYTSRDALSCVSTEPLAKVIRTYTYRIYLRAYVEKRSLSSQLNLGK